MQMHRSSKGPKGPQENISCCCRCWLRRKTENGESMGYVFRVRLASFFAGVAVASLSGFYLLQQDHKLFHNYLSLQMKEISESLDERVSALEKVNGNNNSSQHTAEATE